MAPGRQALSMCDTQNQPKIDLDVKDYYSVQDILKLAVDQFCNQQTESLFKNSTHEIGLYDGTILNEFIGDEFPVGLWEWCKTRISGQIRMCLYTTGVIKTDQKRRSDGTSSLTSSRSQYSGKFARNKKLFSTELKLQDMYPKERFSI